MNCDFCGTHLVPEIRFFIRSNEGYFEFCSGECKDDFYCHLFQIPPIYDEVVRA